MICLNYIFRAINDFLAMKTIMCRIVKKNIDNINMYKQHSGLWDNNERLIHNNYKFKK